MCVFLAHSDGNVREATHIPARMTIPKRLSVALRTDAAHSERLDRLKWRDCAALADMPRIPNG
jgi:hypothetical protein